MLNSNTYFLDWAHDYKNIRWMDDDGNNLGSKTPDINPNDIVVCEDPPQKIVSELDDVQIYSCPGAVVANYRELNDIDKTHDADVETIRKLWSSANSNFRAYRKEFQDIRDLLSQYRDLENQVQRLRNREWAGCRIHDVTKNITCKHCNRRTQESKSLIKYLDDVKDKVGQMITKEFFDLLEGYLNHLKPLYDFLSGINGFSDRKIALFVTRTVDIQKFNQPKDLCWYYGLGVRDNKAARKQKGQRANWCHEIKKDFLAPMKGVKAGIADQTSVINNNPFLKELREYIFNAELQRPMVQEAKYPETYARRLSRRKIATLLTHWIWLIWTDCVDGDFPNYVPTIRLFVNAESYKDVYFSPTEQAEDFRFQNAPEDFWNSSHLNEFNFGKHMVV